MHDLDTTTIVIQVKKYFEWSGGNVRTLKFS